MRRDDKNLARRLREVPVAEPPTDLLTRLKADIPGSRRTDEAASEGLPDRLETGEAAGKSGRWGQYWATAASLTALVGTGFFAYMLMQRTDQVLQVPNEASIENRVETGAESDSTEGWMRDPERICGKRKEALRCFCVRR